MITVNLSICLWLCFIATTLICVCSFPQRDFPKEYSANRKIAGFKNMCKGHDHPVAAEYDGEEDKLHIDTSDYLKNATSKEVAMKGEYGIVPYGKFGLQHKPDGEIDKEEVSAPVKKCKRLNRKTTPKPKLLQGKYGNAMRKSALPTIHSKLPQNHRYLYNHKIYHTLKAPHYNIDYNAHRASDTSEENMVNYDEDLSLESMYDDGKFGVNDGGQIIPIEGLKKNKENTEYEDDINQDDEDDNDDYHNDKYHETNDEEETIPYRPPESNRIIPNVNYKNIDEDSLQPCYEDIPPAVIKTGDPDYADEKVEATPTAPTIIEDKPHIKVNAETEDNKRAKEEQDPTDEIDDPSDVKGHTGKENEGKDTQTNGNDNEQNDYEDESPEEDESDDSNENDESEDDESLEEVPVVMDQEKHFRYIKKLSNTKFDSGSMEDQNGSPENTPEDTTSQETSVEDMPEDHTADEKSTENKTSTAEGPHHSYMTYPANDYFLPHDYAADTTRKTPPPPDNDKNYFQ